MRCWNFKGLAKRTASDKVLRDKAFNIAKSPKFGGYQNRLASMAYKFFMIKSLWGGGFYMWHYAEQATLRLSYRKISRSFT